MFIFSGMDDLRDRFNKMVPKVDQYDDMYSIRYYMGEELMGIIRCKVVKTMGDKKPIRQKYVMITTSDTKNIVEYIIKDHDMMGDPYTLSSTLNKMIYDEVRKIILSMKEGDQE